MKWHCAVTTLKPQVVTSDISCELSKPQFVQLTVMGYFCSNDGMVRVTEIGLTLQEPHFLRVMMVPPVYLENLTCRNSL